MHTQARPRPSWLLRALLMTLLLITASATVMAQENGEDGYAPAARSKTKSKQPHGILDKLFAWSSKPEHGILMGSIQKIDLAKGTLTIVNQEITIDDGTVFLGKLQGLADLKVDR